MQVPPPAQAAMPGTVHGLSELLEAVSVPAPARADLLQEILNLGAVDIRELRLGHWENTGLKVSYRFMHMRPHRIRFWWGSPKVFLPFSKS